MLASFPGMCYNPSECTDDREVLCMTMLLLAVIYAAFISLGLPDSVLGSAWPVMYEGMGVPFSYAGIISTLISIGTVGLIKAVDHFDLTQEVKFSTYAVPLVVGEIRRYLRDNSMLRVPRSLRDLAYRAMKAKEKISRELQKEPSPEEIAKELGENPRAVRNALEAIVDPISLFEPVYSEGGDSVYVLDQVGDTGNTDDSWLDSIAIGTAMESLTPREKKILTLRFYNGKTQTEVSEEIGISQAQISRLEKGALQKVKKQMT